MSRGAKIVVGMTVAALLISVIAFFSSLRSGGKREETIKGEIRVIVPERARSPENDADSQTLNRLQEKYRDKSK